MLDDSSSDTGVQFTVAGAGNLLAGYWFWLTAAAATDGTYYAFSLYSTTDATTGTLITGSGVTGTGTWTAGAWNYCPLATPVALTAGTTYVAAVTQAGAESYFYVTVHYFSTGPGSAGVTSGPLTAPGPAALGGIQGSQNEPSSGGIPHLTSDDWGNFWVDVLVTQPVSATVTFGAYPVITASPLPAFVGMGDARVFTAQQPAATVTIGQPVVTVPIRPATVAAPVTIPQAASGVAVLPLGNPSGGPWVMALDEEFADTLGTGKPDPRVWGTSLISGDMWRSNSAAIGPNGEWEWYPHNLANTAVTGGNLVLTASATDPHTVDPLCPTVGPSGETLTYTSGMISSHPGFNFTYGFIEGRVRLPSNSVHGIYPGFYMVGSDNNWPPEADILEDKGPPNVSCTWWPDSGATGTVTYPDEDGQWHTYGMRWTPADVTYYYDGAQRVTYSTPTAYPMLVYVVFAITSYADGTGYPCQMLVDYIRVWQISGAPAQPVITSITPANGIPTAGSLQVAFTTSGATSYRVTTCTTDFYADLDQTYFTQNLDRAAVTGASSPLTVTGLTNGVRYHVTVAAKTGSLYSLESLPSPPVPVIQTAFLPPLGFSVSVPRPTVAGNVASAVPAAVAVTFPVPAVSGTGGGAGAFTAVGTIIQSQAATISVNPVALGNFILLEVICNPNTRTPTSVAGGNCTWAPLGSVLVGANSSYSAAVFLGTPTGTGAATATVTFTGGTPTGITTVGQQFSTTYSSKAIDGTQGNLDISSAGAGTVTYPSLTPTQAGDLYFCYCAWIGTAVAGATSGYVYQTDAVDDGMVYNVACTTGAQAPTWAANATAAYLGIAVLLKGTGGSAVDAAVTLGGVLAAAASVPAAQPGALATAYASAYESPGGGQGAWTNPANAENAPDGSWATWTAP